MHFSPAMIKRTKGRWQALKMTCQLSDGSIITFWKIFLVFHTTEATLKATDSTSNKEKPMWNLLCWLDQSKGLCRRVKTNLGQPLLLFRAPKLVGISIYDWSPVAFLWIRDHMEAIFFVEVILSWKYFPVPCWQTDYNHTVLQNNG